MELFIFLTLVKEKEESWKTNPASNPQTNKNKIMGADWNIAAGLDMHKHINTRIIIPNLLKWQNNHKQSILLIKGKWPSRLSLRLWLKWVGWHGHIGQQVVLVHHHTGRQIVLVHDHTG